jgi:predicted Zn-dependent peptidase
LTAPAFDPATFETEREAQVSALKEDDDEILGYGLRRLRERFFDQHPFAVGSDGRIEDLEALSVEDLATHYRSLVKASNIVLAVTGDFQREGLIERLSPLLESQIPTQPFEAADASRSA